jgi:hypothetical protein
LEPFQSEMAQLVRAKSVHLEGSHKEKEMEWHESQLDDKKVSIAISQTQQRNLQQ